MTDLWQYVVGSYVYHLNLPDFTRRMKQERLWYMSQWPMPPVSLSNLFGILMALGCLHGDEGGTWESHTWCWTFWRQVPSDLVLGDRGWRHYHLPWDDPFRVSRRRGEIRKLFGLRPYR